MLKNSIFAFLIIGLSFSIKTYGNNKEVTQPVASFDIQVKNDSIQKSEFDKAIELYNSEDYVGALQLSLNLYDEVKKGVNKDLEFSVIFLIGDIYDKTNDFEKSLNFYKKGITLLYNNVENNYISKNIDEDYAKALLRIGAAFHKLSKKDSAKVYYNKLSELNSLNNQILGFQATSFNNLSGIYQQDSLFSIAEEYALKALDIQIKRKDKINQARTYSNLGSIYLSQSDYEQSKQYYLEGIEVIRNDESPRATRVKASLYYNLAWAMRNLEDYKVYDYQELSYNIEDEIRDKEVKRMMETVTARYNVNSVRQEEELKRQKAQRNTWILGISSFFVIIVLVFVLKQFRLRQKNLGLELSRQELMQQQRLEKIKAESQIRILNATLDGKESERKQIAETLHDSVSALLSSANLHLQACKTQFNGSTPIEVDKSQSIINEASQKIRDLSHTLVSSILLKFGLSFAIKDIAEKFSNSELKIDYDTRYIKRYDQGFEIKLYNIIQEFVNNILKHSHASLAKITLVEKKTKLHLIIEDNGQGFDVNKIPEKDGLGINQIDARIQMMKGKFNIETAEGKGTKIIIELPVFEKEPVIIS